MPLGRDLAILGAWVLLLFGLFLGKAIHNDEPYFLAVAEQILRAPFRPFAFDFTWYGQEIPASQINTNPPILGLLLAAAMRLLGRSEWTLRAVFLPFDLAAACSLYLLARRFLTRPLWPTLLIVSSPAYLINLGHLMPEKLSAAFGFSSLYLLVMAVDRRKSWMFLSAALLSLAIMSKYNAVFLLAPALVYAYGRGWTWKRLLAYSLLALLPLSLWFAIDFATGGGGAGTLWSIGSRSAGSWWSTWSHKGRSFLAFLGGCGLITAAWPWLQASRRLKLGALFTAVLLFLPAWDLGPPVALVDRATGVLFAAGGLLGLVWLMSEARKEKGWPLWASWASSVCLIQLLYWSIMSRIMLFAIPPLVFASAAGFERRRARMGRLYAASLAVVVAVTLSLAWVDYSYAKAQKEFARHIEENYARRSRRVWYSGYMGLQYYLSRAGAQGLDLRKGGWDLPRAGDVVVVLGINSSLQKPPRPLPANVHEFRLGHPVPLRLMSGWSGEGGFYSNVSGFLPFSISSEPLEEFKTIELL
ncbi:MAG: glycosyltransferase family 39 protein [Elusimicrobia bacterium]|nr:glycosyltransferase family 39 protein [Elusimicrobiota bacterium]